MMNAYIKKVTDIPWLATDIPSNWEVKRFKDIFVESDEVSKSGKEDLLSVSEYYGVARRKDKMAEEEYESRAESLEGYKICHKGDLVSNIMLTWKKALGVSDFYGIVSPAYAVYKGVNIYPKYYHYLLRSDMYAAEFRRQSKGIIDSRLRLYTDRFYAIKTLYPPIDEQKQIANYLDEKIAAINTTIAALDNELKLLKKFKQSKIAEVVTHGLTPNVPTKSSPLGEIPAHWEVARIKRVVKELESGKREDDGKEEVLSIGGEHIQDGEFYLEHKMFVSEDTYSSTRGKIQRGDILIVKDGATIGKCMYVDDMPEPKMLLNEHVYRLACTSKYSNLYFYYVIASQFSQDWFWSRNMSSAQESIVQNTLLTLPIAIPPLEEQLEIAKYLNEECKKIDKKCMLIDEQIKKMQLLKRALINEVVTGKRQFA